MGRRILGWLGVLWALPVSLLAFVLVLLLRPKWLGGGVRWARVRCTLVGGYWAHGD